MSDGLERVDRSLKANLKSGLLVLPSCSCACHPVRCTLKPKREYSIVSISVTSKTQTKPKVCRLSTVKELCHPVFSTSRLAPCDRCCQTRGLLANRKTVVANPVLALFLVGH